MTSAPLESRITRIGTTAQAAPEYDRSPLINIIHSDAFNGKDGLISHIYSCKKEEYMIPIKEDLVEACRKDWKAHYRLLESEAHKLAAELASSFFGMSLEKSYTIKLKRESSPADGKPLKRGQRYITEEYDITHLGHVLREIPDEEISFMQPIGKFRGRLINPQRTSYHFLPPESKRRKHPHIKEIRLRFKGSWKSALKAGDYLWDIRENDKHRSFVTPDYGITDIVGMRIVTADEKSCYVVEEELSRLKGVKFVTQARKDYIAKPKVNTGYRSLHNIILTGDSQLMEMQIRSQEMDAQAESEPKQAHDATYDREKQEKRRAKQEETDGLYEQTMGLLYEATGTALRPIGY